MIICNNFKLKFTTFPNGETLVDGQQIYNIIKQTQDKDIKIDLIFENDSDLIKLLFVKRFIDEELNKMGEKQNLILNINYMPYSRMDRVEGTSVFTLKYISEFINLMNFNLVNIIEPHSEVTPALLNNNCVINETIKLLNESNELSNNDYIFFPDSGAFKRYSKFIKHPKQLIGFKERDFKTGQIKSLHVCGEIKDTNFKVIILDDLCSKGGTFLLSAQKLKKLGASEIILIVSHCENTIFEGELLNSDLINKIITTDSILSKMHKKIKIIPLSSYKNI